MKKTLLLLAVSVLFVKLSAQEIIKGGNMEDATKWTVINVGDAYDPATITFNYKTDVPAKGKGGCLRLSGGGVTRTFIYQKVTLTKKHSYYLSCALKDISKATFESYWLEVNLVNRLPVLVGDGTSSDFAAGASEFQMGMHYWKTVNGIDYNRIDAGYNGLMEKTIDFAYLGALSEGTADSIITNPRDANFKGKHGDSIVFTLPDTVRTTTWYVLIKAGMFTTKGTLTPAFDWLLDELTLFDLTKPSQISAPAIGQNSFEIFPNPITDGIVKIKSNSANSTSYNVYNTLGMLIKSGKTNGSINLSDVSKGLYVLKLDNGIKTEQHKIILK